MSSTALSFNKPKARYLNLLFSKLLSLDKVLLSSMAAAMAFSMHGFTWGKVECWNRDQMALRSLRDYGKPSNYKKPPLHTFLNRIVVQSGVDAAESVASRLTKTKQNFNRALLISSRLLVIGLFMGTIAIAFTIAREFYGLAAARIVALLFGTSAGFVTYNHFLSCDSPLLFWMLLSFFFSSRIMSGGKTSDYIFAGLLTGAATNTKYNGLAVGIAVVVAHLLANNQLGFKAKLLHRKLLTGLLMVPTGLLATNPYMILDYKRFVSDFMYNYMVTPRYGGQAEGVGYIPLLLKVPEIIGIPGACLLVTAIVFSVFLICKKQEPLSRETQCFLLSLSVFLLYFYKIGSFPREKTRFILPAVPFLILMTGPFFVAATARRFTKSALWILLLPILGYNLICSFYVGLRFKDDPRNHAVEWMIKNLKPGQVVESTPGSPHWRRLPEFKVLEIDLAKTKQLGSKDFARESCIIDYRMPAVNERAELFERIFKGNKWVEGEASKREGVPDLNQFTAENLLRRNPDVITVHSSDLDVKNQNVRAYYANLLTECLPYRKVYDRSSAPSPAWVYPEEIDFLNGRMVILVRR